MIAKHIMPWLLLLILVAGFVGLPALGIYSHLSGGNRESHDTRTDLEKYGIEAEVIRNGVVVPPGR